MNFKLINVAWRLSIKSSSTSLKNERFNYKLFLVCLPVVLCQISNKNSVMLFVTIIRTQPWLHVTKIVKIKCLPPQSTQLRCRRASSFCPICDWVLSEVAGLNQFFSPSVLALGRLMQILAQMNNHYANIFMSCQPEFSLRSFVAKFHFNLN